MDTLCLIAQLAAHLSIFTVIMIRYNRLKVLESRPLSLLASLLAGLSLAASIRIVLTWPEPITVYDYLESVLVVLIAMHTIRCGGHMTRILWINRLNAQH